MAVVLSWEGRNAKLKSLMYKGCSNCLLLETRTLENGKIMLVPNWDQSLESFSCRVDREKLLKLERKSHRHVYMAYNRSYMA